MEIIFSLIGIAFALAVLFYGSVFFIIGLSYGYWGLSIGMAPVMWLILLIGMIVGLIYTIKNAIKATRTVYGKRGK